VVAVCLSLAAAIWLGTVAAAYRAIRRFESTPGRAAVARKSWPAESGLVRTSGAATLVMLVHPQCSCTRASMQELGAVIEKAPRTMRTYVVVYRPRGAKPGWEQTDVYASAMRLRNTRVIVDEEGREAKRFGAFTSGQTFLYDAAGRLRFEGGITLLRGHAGNNSGRQEMIRLANAPEGQATHPVFGCSIFSRGELR